MYWPELLSRNTAAPHPQEAVGLSSTLCWILNWPWSYTQWRRPDLPWEGNNPSLLCPCPVWSQRCHFTTKVKRKRKEEWPHPATAESTKGMKPLGTSSAALGNSLPRPFWRHHQYFQPTKQSSLWCFLSMLTSQPCLAQSPVSQCSFPWQWDTWTCAVYLPGSGPTLSYPGAGHLRCLLLYVTEFAPADVLLRVSPCSNFGYRIKK